MYVVNMCVVAHTSSSSLSRRRRTSVQCSASTCFASTKVPKLTQDIYIYASRTDKQLFFVAQVLALLVQKYQN